MAQHLMTQNVSSEAILEILLAAGNQGACLIEPDGRVRQVVGASAGWAPQIGELIYHSPLFAGLEPAFEALRTGGEPLLLPTVKLPGDGGIIDLRISWQKQHQCFAAISNSADDRVALYADAANTVRK